MTARHRALEDEDIALIERVKMMPSLYDPQNANFRLANRKEQDWDTISNDLGLLSGVDARRRWTVLRDRYSRELKQLRLHPEKDDFGKNDFFRLMDFLRRFVRKRRERRNLSRKNDSSWEGSVEEVKLVARLSQSAEMLDEDDHGEEGEEGAVEEEHSFEDTQHEYVGKMEEAEEEEITNEAEEYQEFVEVDATETYEEYVDNPPVQVADASRSSSSSNSNTTKPLHNTQLIPIMLPQTNSSSGCAAGGASYTVTNTSMPALMQPHQQQQPPSEHIHRYQQQPQLPELHHYHQKSHAHLQPPAAAPAVEAAIETEDDFFCKSIAAYLRQLTRRHKIKAKVEMFQILEKYIELEESTAAGSAPQ